MLKEALKEALKAVGEKQREALLDIEQNRDVGGKRKKIVKLKGCTRP